MEKSVDKVEPPVEDYLSHVLFFYLPLLRYYFGLPTFVGGELS